MIMKFARRNERSTGRTMLRNLLPGDIQKRIVRVSLFLAGWELLRSELEDRLRDMLLTKLVPADRSRITSTLILRLERGRQVLSVIRRFHPQ
jgi:hypothetical protein